MKKTLILTAIFLATATLATQASQPLDQPQTQQAQKKECYIVKYRVQGKASSTTAQTTLMLYGPSESEAIAELKRRGSVGKDKTIIILSITKKH